MCLQAESAKAETKHIASSHDNFLTMIWFFIQYFRDPADDLV